MERRDEEYGRVLRVGRVEFGIRIDDGWGVPGLTTDVVEGAYLECAADDDLSDEADEYFDGDEVGGGCAWVDGCVSVCESGGGHGLGRADLDEQVAVRRRAKKGCLRCGW